MSHVFALLVILSFFDFLLLLLHRCDTLSISGIIWRLLSMDNILHVGSFRGTIPLLPKSKGRRYP